jgi:hypothetical protein
MEYSFVADKIYFGDCSMPRRICGDSELGICIFDPAVEKIAPWIRRKGVSRRF